jgi:hypothetical protein
MAQLLEQQLADAERILKKKSMVQSVSALSRRGVGTSNSIALQVGPLPCRWLSFSWRLLNIRASVDQLATQVRDAPGWYGDDQIDMFASPHFVWRGSLLAIWLIGWLMTRPGLLIAHQDSVWYA